MPYIFKRMKDEDKDLNSYLSEGLNPTQINNTKFIFNFILGNLNDIKMANAQNIGKSFYTLEDLLKIAKAAYGKVNDAYERNKLNPSNEKGELSKEEISKMARTELNRLYNVIKNIINDLKQDAVHKEDVDNEKYKEENKNQNIDVIKNKWNNEINNFIEKKKKETINYLMDLKEMDSNTKTRENKIEMVENFKEECLKKINEYITLLKSDKYQRILSQEQIKVLFKDVLENKKEVIQTEYNDLKKNYLEEDKNEKINRKNYDYFKKEISKKTQELANAFENELGQNDDSLKEKYKLLINEEDYKKLKSKMYSEVIDKVNDIANQNDELKLTLRKIVQNKEKERNFINSIKSGIDEELKKIKEIYANDYEKAIKNKKGNVISAWTGKVIGPEEKVIRYIGNENFEDNIRYGKVPVYSDKDSILTRYINKHFSFSKKLMKTDDLYDGNKPKNNFITNQGSNKKRIEVYETTINGNPYYIDARLKQNQSLFKYYLLNEDKDNFKCYNNVEEYKNRKKKKSTEEE